MSKHVFCRDVCLERGEPLPGTGKTASRYLLVQWPRAKWRVPRYESADMSPELGEAVRLAMKADAHVALVDRVGDSQSIPQLQSDGVAASFETEAELIAAINRWTAGEPLVGQPDDRIVILCCTDSRRDACCARFGFAAYKAMVAVADPARFHIVQCTHVGGCRFAASMVVLPRRERYGRVDPEHVEPFLTALDRGEVYVPSFRGRTTLPEPQQVAELAALQWAGAQGFAQSAVKLDAFIMNDADAQSLVLSARVADQTLSMTLRRDIFDVQGRCTALAEEPDPTPRWLVETLEPKG